MFKLDNDLIYLAGVIAGDGHLKGGVKWKDKDNSPDYGIFIHSNNKKYLELILKLIKEKVNTKTSIKQGKRAYYISIRNKKLYTFFNKEFKIPLGKKSDKIIIPKNLTKEQTKYFLGGLFDTDGGIRRNSIGYCSASKQIITEINQYLNSIKIENTIDSWINKKYQKEYYGIRIKKSSVNNFLKTIPLKNIKKLEKICRDAGVVKRVRLRIFPYKKPDGLVPTQVRVLFPAFYFLKN